MKTQGNWEQAEIQFLLDNLNKKSFPELSQALGRSENAIKLFLYRRRIPLKPQVKCPSIPKLLEIKFGNASWFVPNREFFQTVKISQRRWADLMQGYAMPTRDELTRISRTFNLQADEVAKLLDAVQLELFPEEDGAANSGTNHSEDHR